ncbi:DNA polymerase III subunit delta [Thermoleophilia bacterium SCSIO 60948]|nr:DNA polymerase III subunit delta [Thermoleophilia bacterium SCSIO 60948]
MSSPPEILPAYLIHGGDRAKIGTAVDALRRRAEREGGPGALEVFDPEGTGAPDATALVNSIPAMSLTAERRYMLASDVWRWNSKDQSLILEALGALPGDVTVVLVAALDSGASGADRSRSKRAVAKLAPAVEAAGGRVIEYPAPKVRDLPRWIAEEARRRGFEVEPEAARILAERLGESTPRLSSELDRLSVWAEPGGTVAGKDVGAMIADTSEEVVWSLSDALVDRDAPRAVSAAERLSEQGEALTPLVYAVARRLRDAHLAACGLEAGRSAKELEGSLPMHPYAAKLLLRSVQGRSVDEIRAGSCAIADLEWWSRGGADYPEDVAMTLAIRRAAGLRTG